MRTKDKSKTKRHIQLFIGLSFMFLLVNSQPALSTGAPIYADSNENIVLESPLILHDTAEPTGVANTVTFWAEGGQLKFKEGTGSADDLAGESIVPPPALFTDGGAATYLTSTTDNLAFGTSTADADGRVTIETATAAGTLGIPIHLRHDSTSTPDGGDGIKMIEVEMEDAETTPGTQQDAGDIRMVWEGEPVQGGGITTNMEFHLANADAVEHIMTIFHDNKAAIGTTSGNNAHTLTLSSFESQTTAPTLYIENTSTGDASLEFGISGRNFSMGIDNSTTNNDFVISNTTSLDSQNALTLFGNVANVGINNNLAIGDVSSGFFGDKLFIESAFTNNGITINNTAGDGDPTIKFELSDIVTYTMGVDDSDSDKFKIGTSLITTNTGITINASGQVGIGETNPTSPLDVNGNLNIDSGDLIVDTSAAGTIDTFVGNSGTNGIIFDVSQGTVINSTANVQFNIDSNASDGLGNRQFEWRSDTDDTTTVGTEIMTLNDYGMLRRPCPTGFTSIERTTSSTFGYRNQLGCMQTNQNAGTATPWTAMQNCWANYGGRLPTLNEWYISMNNYALTNETDSWEWIDDSSHISGIGMYFNLMGNGSIQAVSTDTFANSWQYRCWIDR